MKYLISHFRTTSSAVAAVAAVGAGAAAATEQIHPSRYEAKWFNNNLLP